MVVTVRNVPETNIVIVTFTTTNAVYDLIQKYLTTLFFKQGTEKKYKTSKLPFANCLIKDLQKT